jgi:hypothetical protein
MFYKSSEHGLVCEPLYGSRDSNRAHFGHLLLPEQRQLLGSCGACLRHYGLCKT